jgi:hypothetical protein
MELNARAAEISVVGSPVVQHSMQVSAERQVQTYWPCGTPPPCLQTALALADRQPQDVTPAPPQTPQAQARARVQALAVMLKLLALSSQTPAPAWARAQAPRPLMPALLPHPCRPAHRLFLKTLPLVLRPGPLPQCSAQTKCSAESPRPRHRRRRCHCRMFVC